MTTHPALPVTPQTDSGKRLMEELAFDGSEHAEESGRATLRFLGYQRQRSEWYEARIIAALDAPAPEPPVALEDLRRNAREADEGWLLVLADDLERLEREYR